MSENGPRGGLPVEHVVVVFGAKVSRDGRPLRALTRRLRHALAEAAADPTALVVVSGGPVGGRPVEALVMRDWLVANGLEPARIVVEGEAMTTRGNAARCARILAWLRARRVTLVTERYHMWRSLLLLRRALGARGLGGLAVRPSPAPDHLEGLEHLTRRIGEAMKLAQDVLALRRA